ncbi:hypothetical protein ACLOJK_027469 [Asimina triloba]
MRPLMRSVRLRPLLPSLSLSPSLLLSLPLRDLSLSLSDLSLLLDSTAIGAHCRPPLWSRHPQLPPSLPLPTPSQEQPAFRSYRPPRSALPLDEGYREEQCVLMGIVLMELVSGLMPTDKMFGEDMDMVRWAESRMPGPSREELLNPALKPLAPDQESTMFEAAPAERPSARRVSDLLLHISLDNRAAPTKKALSPHFVGIQPVIQMALLILKLIIAIYIVLITAGLNLKPCSFWSLSLDPQVGDRVTNDFHVMKGMVDFAWSHSVISDEMYVHLNRVYDFKLSRWSNDCNEAMGEVYRLYQEIDIYNIYAPTCVDSSSGFSATFKNRFMQVYWETVKGNGGAAVIWVYSGDTDGCVPVLGTRYCMEALGLPVISPWRY